MNKKKLALKFTDKKLTRPNWIKQNHRSPFKLWLDKNECADPILNKLVFKSLTKIHPESVFSYPDLSKLYAKLAKYARVNAENLLLTAGSDGAIRACFETCIHPGDKVVITKPTFAMYDVYSKIYGADVTWLEYKSTDNGPILSIDKILNTIKDIQPKMVCLPNPDSPTGTIFSPNDMKKIIGVAGDVGALMLVDEAYYPLYQWTAASLIDEYDHLVVVRSFSKSWGAAGLRVGYAISNNELITLIHKQRPMYEIGNVPAQTIEILLDHENDMLQSVARVNAGKQYFQTEMTNLGFTSYASHGNFFHIKFGKYADPIHNALDDKVYYRKDFNVACLEGYSRFSATTKGRFEPIVSCIIAAVNDFDMKK